jgi:ubiquinone biosynthesis protein UbiJ
MPATPVWLAAADTLLNRGIGQSIQAAAAARRLSRTSLQIEVAGVGRIRAAVAGGRLALTSGGELDADAIISGSAPALFELFNGRLDRAAAARGDRGQPVRISGDAEIAARYRDLLALARPDWEEELSRLVGDLPARRLSNAARAAFSWARGVGRTAGQNLAEYLQEESRDLVSQPELEEFVADVDRLRETADRVEARLARAEQRLKGPA